MGPTMTLSRFEFALKRGDDYTKIQSPDSIRGLMHPYLNPDDVEIVRSTYTNSIL